MLRIAFCAVTTLAVLGLESTARGQGYDPNCCAPQPQCCAPQPVIQQCYQTIPVTEYRDVRQTVQQPVCETAYVDQPVTEYRQVCETKVAQIPTCQYQTVTEYRQVQRDMGCWVTQYQCNPRIAPCQYDNRPNLLGFVNRAGYSVRMAFTPQMTATRVWKPNIVTASVPVQRQVAIRGVQQVNYQVSRMVPFTTTRKVAVNTVRMVAREVVTKQAVTVYRTVPTGTATAFGFMPTATAFGQGIIGSPTGVALQPTPVNPANRYQPSVGTATATRPTEVPVKPSTTPDKNGLPDALKNDDPVPHPVEKGSGYNARPVEQEVARVEPRRVQPAYLQPTSVEPVRVEARKPIASPAAPSAAIASRPSIARVGRWMASRAAKTEATATNDTEMLAKNTKN